MQKHVWQLLAQQPAQPCLQTTAAHSVGGDTVSCCDQPQSVRSSVVRMVNIIRNEDYENEQRDTEAGLASGLRGAMEMKRGLLRQATKTEEEQVSESMRHGT